MEHAFAYLERRSLKAAEIANGIRHQVYDPDLDVEIAVTETEIPEAQRYAKGSCAKCRGTGLRRVQIDGVNTRLLCDCPEAEVWVRDGGHLLTVPYDAVISPSPSPERPRYADPEPQEAEAIVPSAEQESIWGGPSLAGDLSDDAIRAAMAPKYGED